MERNYQSKFVVYRLHCGTVCGNGETLADAIKDAAVFAWLYAPEDLSKHKKFSLPRPSIVRLRILSDYYRVIAEGKVQRSFDWKANKNLSEGQQIFMTREEVSERLAAEKRRHDAAIDDVVNRNLIRIFGLMGNEYFAEQFTKKFLAKIRAEEKKKN